MEVVEFMSKNQFYINEELVVHIGATFVKPGDIIEESDQNTKADLISDFNEQIKDAQKMIVDEIGISKINKSFKSITKVKHSSPIIDYYRELKREV